MTSIERTAYPRFKRLLSARKLQVGVLSKPVDVVVGAAPLHPGQLTIGTITVWEYPGGKVVADEIVTLVSPHDHKALDATLDKLGYTVDRWEVLPGYVRYGAAFPGHLAERDWYRCYLVLTMKETTVGAVDPGRPTERPRAWRDRHRCTSAATRAA